MEVGCANHVFASSRRCVCGEYRSFFLQILNETAQHSCFAKKKKKKTCPRSFCFIATFQHRNHSSTILAQPMTIRYHAFIHPRNGPHKSPVSPIVTFVLYNVLVYCTNFSFLSLPTITSLHFNLFKPAETTLDALEEQLSSNVHGFTHSRKYHILSLP